MTAADAGRPARRAAAAPLPELVVPDQPAWRAWLAEHHLGSPGVRLVLAKKGTVDPTSLVYAQALDEALCHGWIDGQVNRRDEVTYLQRYTPRRPRSIWSKRNVGHVARLTGAGLMRPQGVAEVQRAQADGRWDAAYAGPATMALPDDLVEAVAADPAAAATCAGLTSQNRYAMAFRLGGIRGAGTRERRIAEYVAMLARGETLHPQRAGPRKLPPP